MFALIALAASIVPQASDARPQAPDTAAIRATARAAEAAYERTARRHAPLTGWSGGSGDCHEIVGRFCLRFDDDPAVEPPPEPARIVDARRAAIDTLRKAFGALPADSPLAGPLIRLLIEDDRAREALAVARTYEALASASAPRDLLVGLAFHAAGEDTAAAARFARALSQMDSDERARVRDLDWLLASDERRHYRVLSAAEQSRYADAVWALADPLYLTPINERWVEHAARYAYARLLERVPIVRGMSRWGRDLEELLIRYGVAYRRGRELGPRLDDTGIVEYFHPDQLAYVPEALLSRGYPPAPPPGDSWPLSEERARSGYAPRNIRSMEPLPHQLTRIPVRGGWLVRVDAAFGLDSLARMPPAPLPGDTAQPPAPTPGEVEAGLFLLGSAYAMQRTTDVVVRRPLAGDSAVFTLAVVADSGEYVYSAEAYEPETRTARRARYTLALPAATGLRMSDVMLARRFDGATPATHTDVERLRPLTDLVLSDAAVVGLYAEVLGLGVTEYDVEVAARRADRRSLPARLVRWLGRTLGISDAAAPARVRWSARHEDVGPLVIALDLPLAGLEDGLYLIEIAVTDRESGERVTGRRLVRVERSED